MGRPHMGSEIVCLLCGQVFASTSVGVGVGVGVGVSVPKSPNVNSVCSVGAMTTRIVHQ